MGRFKIYIISALVIGCGFIFLNKNELKAKNCCSGGRCTGSSNCRVCTNCSRCAHCGAGGSCGVCASYSAPEPVSKPQKSSSPKESNRTSTTSKSNSTTRSISNSDVSYVVNAKTLNIRSAPSTNSSIVYTLKYGDKVTIIKVINDTWVQVAVNSINGYTCKQYLSKK